MFDTDSSDSYQKRNQFLQPNAPWTTKTSQPTNLLLSKLWFWKTTNVWNSFENSYCRKLLVFFLCFKKPLETFFFDITSFSLKKTQQHPHRHILLDRWAFVLIGRGTGITARSFVRPVDLPPYGIVAKHLNFVQEQKGHARHSNKDVKAPQ